MYQKREYNVIQRLTKLYRLSKSYDISTTPHEQVNKEIRWILQNRYQTVQFNGQSVANLWTILLNFNYGYKKSKRNSITKIEKIKIPDDIWQELLVATAEQVRNITAKELINILSVFSQMNVWKNANNDFANFILKFLIAIELNIAKVNTVKTLRTMANLGFCWETFWPELKGKLLTEISQAVKVLDTSEIANLMWSCSMLGLSWEELDKKTQITILDKIPKIIEDNIQIIHENPTRNLTVRTKWNEATTILRQLQQARLYFNWSLKSSCVVKLDSVLSDLISKELQDQSHNPMLMIFQNNVTKIIREIAKKNDISYEAEGTPLNFKPVDIYFTGKKIILEIHGDDIHYNNHGMLRPKDAMNKRIYEKHGYQVICIKQSEWKSAANKYDFVLAKLQSVSLVPSEDEIKSIKVTHQPTILSAYPVTTSYSDISASEILEDKSSVNSLSQVNTLSSYPNLIFLGHSSNSVKETISSQRAEEITSAILRKAIGKKYKQVDPDDLQSVKHKIVEYFIGRTFTPDEYKKIKKTLVNLIRNGLYEKNYLELINPYKQCYTYGVNFDDDMLPEIALKTVSCENT